MRLDYPSAWLLKSLENIVKRWLHSVRDTASPLYHDYIEGMLSDYAEVRKKWRDEKKYGDLRVAWHSLSWGGQIFWGVFRLNIHRIRRGLSLLFFAVEQHFVLTQASATLSLKGLIIKEVFSWLHQVTGSVGIQVDTIEVMLSPTAQIIGWSDGAASVFGFHADDVMGKVATDCFIPEVETSGRSLTDLIRNICSCPHLYSLNINENQNQEGIRYWLLWANVPVFDKAGELIEIRCRGIKVEDPLFMQSLLLRWQDWKMLPFRGLI
ncbi:MAG: PAS domain-containing protein [Oscillatoriophycideae cyanobacterium NC_groundwater_1537_Pr4_S-0.65um_50_18]|nr:PAS domain-containing protein [Oscillatoriophycideae cyanobacterium NC_groundwater_1537_Pr4_S-0.65um_50_18]